MARSVFYSFHYRNDITRVMNVRNRWVTYGNQTASGILDHADFMKLQAKGDAAIKKWIDGQMEYTSATIVLIGSETLERPYVQYEIQQSLKRGNAIIGVYINKLKDFNQKSSTACSKYTIVCNRNGKSLSFNKIADAIYDYVDDNGYLFLGDWVEKAVRWHRAFDNR